MNDKNQNTLGGWGNNTANSRKQKPVLQKTDMGKVMRRRAVEESIAAKKLLEEMGIGA